MRIYTKTGDAGETGLFGGPRVSKDHVRIEAYGTVDELNAAIGLVRVESPEPRMDAILGMVQHDLFSLGAELATPEPERFGTRWDGGPNIQRLESSIDEFDAELPALRQFILPGGSPAACVLHLARAICRRAERRVITLANSTGEHVSNSVIVYLNRLGDLLFVLARAANHAKGIVDTPWKKEPKAGAAGE